MLELKILGDDVLKRQSSLVPEVDKKIQDLIESMFELMYEGKGLGLAAPQIGGLELRRLNHATVMKLGRSPTSAPTITTGMGYGETLRLISIFDICSTSRDDVGMSGDVMGS